MQFRGDGRARVSVAPRRRLVEALSVVSLSVVLVACSGAAEPAVGAPLPVTTERRLESSVVRTPTDGGHAPVAPSQDVEPSEVVAGEGSGAAAGPAPPQVQLEVSERVLEAPIHSLAIDPDRGLVAALGSEPWLYDGKRWNAIALPEALRAREGEREQVRIHFGRDHLPRIMGNRFDSQGARQLYLRYRHGAWRAEVRELAAFGAKPRGALYGVLGWDDPEVVCKAGEFCLVKQRSGWSQVALPAASPAAVQRVDLGANGAYALLERRLLRLDTAGWTSLGGNGPWTGVPAGAWVDATGAWVAVPDEDALYRHDGTSWQRIPSPVREPRGLWGRVPGAVWVAGRDGVGRVDARGALRVRGIDGPVHEIVGVRERFWCGGQGGVWEARVPDGTWPGAP